VSFHFWWEFKKKMDQFLYGTDWMRAEIAKIGSCYCWVFLIQQNSGQCFNLWGRSA